MGELPSFGGKRSCHVWKESGVTAQVKMEVEVGTLLLSNDKNNVIAENALSYFLCLSSSLKCRSHVSGLNNNY